MIAWRKVIPHVVFLHHRTSSADVDYDNIAVRRSKFKCRTTTKPLIIGKDPLIMEAEPGLVIEEGETDSYLLAIAKQPSRNVEVLLFGFDGHCMLDAVPEYGLQGRSRLPQILRRHYVPRHRTVRTQNKDIC